MWVWGEFQVFLLVFIEYNWETHYFLHFVWSGPVWVVSYHSMQVQNVTAAYVMKCDDDTFVRVDTVLKEIEGISRKRSLYMGNLNLLHRPLRSGKWAVTYEVRKLLMPSCEPWTINTFLFSLLRGIGKLGTELRAWAQDWP